jgi:hypothetical protein
VFVRTLNLRTNGALASRAVPHPSPRLEDHIASKSGMVQLADGFVAAVNDDCGMT